MPDLTCDNKHLYPHASISFGEYGAYILQKSLKDLCLKTAATNLRFWGKIRGTKQDYYIAEVTADATGGGEEGGEEEGTANNEAPGTGVNAMTYFVTNCPASGKWTQLPHLNPDDL